MLAVTCMHRYHFPGWRLDPKTRGVETWHHDDNEDDCNGDDDGDDDDGYGDDYVDDVRVEEVRSDDPTSQFLSSMWHYAIIANLVIPI